MLNNFLQANWNAPINVKTLITTRVDIDNKSFNLALHVSDQESDVYHNREVLAKCLPNKPQWLNQTHTNLVLDLDKPYTTPPNYDAALTRMVGTVCVVMTADCLPIFITDTKGSFVAAIHAGWRGVATQIIANAIRLSKTDSKSILAYIGPAICATHFEVGMDVFEIFTKLNKNNAKFFNPKTNNKFECDLISIAKLQLLNLGVIENNIYLSDQCTYCNNDLFYSYRKEKSTGRFASLIWLE